MVRAGSKKKMEIYVAGTPSRLPTWGYAHELENSISMELLAMNSFLSIAFDLTFLVQFGFFLSVSFSHSLRQLLHSFPESLYFFQLHNVFSHQHYRLNGYRIFLRRL